MVVPCTVLHALQNNRRITTSRPIVNTPPSSSWWNRFKHWLGDKLNQSNQSQPKLKAIPPSLKNALEKGSQTSQEIIKKGIAFDRSELADLLPQYRVLEVKPEFLLTQRYNKDAPVGVPVQGDNYTFFQIISLWQDLTANKFFSHNINSAQDYFPHGLNVNEYLKFLRALEINLFLYESKKNKVTSGTNIGGEDASCGYHAVRNGLGLIDLIYKRSKSVRNSFEDLLSITNMVSLFGSSYAQQIINQKYKEGTWREFIIKNRYWTLVLEKLEPQLAALGEDLFNFLLINNLAQGIDVENNFINKFKENIRNTLKTKFFDKFSFSYPRITLDTPIKSNEFLSFIEKYHHEYPSYLMPDAYPFIEAVEQFNNHSPTIATFNNVQGSIELEEWESLKESWKNRQKTNYSLSLNGDWLQQNEMESLIQWITGKESKVIFVNTLEQLKGEGFEIKEQLEAFKNAEFALRLFVLQPQERHWICLVAHKVKGRVYYYIMDSQNASQYNNRVVRAIIDATH